MISGQRVGLFFAVLGGFLLALFVASDLAEQPNFNLFFFGLAGLAIGLVLANRSRPDKVESERFRWIRSLRDRRAQKRYRDVSKRS
jgi:hypothetical protein